MNRLSSIIGIILRHGLFMVRCGAFIVLLVALISVVPQAQADETTAGKLTAPSINPAMPKAQTDIVGPANSGAFGTSVIALPNGNFVVTDPLFDAPGPVVDVGAVYLYNGVTLALISTLKGSSANDQVGSGGITILNNGNFVVSSPNWNTFGAATAGAVTWCNATTGCNGTVSSANSLVGGRAGDQVGIVNALSNGNYVVTSSNWDNPTGPIADVGAVTWCNGTTGCKGLVTFSNSLTGGTAGDMVGSSGVTALTNGNYVVNSPGWTNPSGPLADVGAVTLCNGTTGCTGLVNSSNSLIGGTASDFVGNVTALTNGNYVVRSPFWDNPSPAKVDVGAVTWCNGTTGCAGLVSSANSLIGGTANDDVGSLVTALTNGNYVVKSLDWDNPSGPIQNVGAVTWCSGTTGCAGLVTSSNSLIGGTASDQVGNVTALTNGNYVVRSQFWDNPSPAKVDVGAVTWCNGTTGCAGLVSSANSLIGGTANDNVGSFVIALTNGNYVVASNLWHNPSGPIPNVGAVTWCNGTSGCTGLVTSSNSLIGGTAGDGVGCCSSSALTNGNYVVVSRAWDNPSGPIADVGAVTWCNGTTGCTGLVSSSNSLIGSTAFDSVGDDSVKALTNGNYVVASSFWDNPPDANVGAVTWCKGTTGCSGLVTPGNSLIGGTVDDRVGGGAVTPLLNGHYVVLSSLWDNPVGSVVNARAVTLGNGDSGTFGSITSGNSVLGTIANGVNADSFDYIHHRLIVGRKNSNIVSVFDCQFCKYSLYLPLIRK